MKQRRMVFALACALVISGGCTYLLSRRLAVPVRAQSVPDLMYAAAAHSLQAGELLKPDSVELVAWPGNRPVSGAFFKPAEIVGRAVLYPLGKGEPILERDLSASGAGVGLAAQIPSGMRATALRSDEVAGVAGFLTPGSHVDVLVTFKSSLSPDPSTATVLQNAAVLAVGQRAQPDPEGKPTSVAVVTLLLTPEEAERAVLASSQGSVHFVLRNGADDGRPENTPMLLSMLAGASPVVKVERTPFAHPAAPKYEGIETVLGTQPTATPGGAAQ
ncbi:MAG TPA: Flp pilus assembly protein CpaB [Acidobacteriaceae bacterium]